MLRSRLKFGEEAVGFIRMIRVAGSNGIVDITWAEDMRMMRGRSKDGKLFADTMRLFKNTAFRTILIAEENNDKRFCIGPMTAGKFETSNLKRK